MSNPFNFDPFAAPAPSASSSSATSNANTNKVQNNNAVDPQKQQHPVAVNPFDNFNFFSNTNNAQQQQSTTNTNNAGGVDWSQTARDVMSSSNNIWQNVASSTGLPLGNNNPLSSASTSSSIHSSSNSSLTKQQGYKRIVPYTSPISTLESNWDPWLYVANNAQQQQQSCWTNNGGNINTYLIVRANTGCCLNGGVESLLKWSKSRSNSSSSKNGSAAESGGVEGVFDSLSIMDPPTVSEESVSVSSSNIGGTFETTTTNTNTKPSVTSSMRFLKSGLKKAQQSIERSVTTMAIKADGGKNRDQLCVSLHYCGFTSEGGGAASNSIRLGMAKAMGVHPNSSELNDVCLSRTEWVEIPAAPGEVQDEEEGVLFSIPLCLPDLSFLEETTPGNNNSVQLTVRLYIRSGATLLKAVANREYCIGESLVLYSNIMQLMMNNSAKGSNGGGQQQQGGSLRCGTINVPFTTGMLAETSSFSKSASFNNSSGSSSSHQGNDIPAALHITATPRIKFNPPCTFGWSLSDPMSTSPPPSSGDKHNLNWLNMFQLPLDQGYVFNVLGHHRQLNSTNYQQHQQTGGGGGVSNSNALLLVNERAVESTLTLPLSTACAQLFSQAAMHSQTLASNALKKTRRKEALFLSPNEDEYRSKAIIDAAMLDRAANVELGVVALVLLGQETPGVQQCGFGGVGGDVPSVKTNLSFQPPHCIFEESLVHGASCPLLDEASGAGYINGGLHAGSFAASGGVKEAISTRFCPRILSGTDDLLPGVMGSNPNGKYVGSIRLEVALDYANGNNGPVDNISTGISTNTSVEGLLQLEEYLDNGKMQKEPVLVPALDANTGRRIGTFVLLLRVTSNQLPMSPTSPADSTFSASCGLVSVVGLDTLTQDIGLAPYIDCDAPPSNSQLASSPPTPQGIRRRQIATMGQFVTPRYLNHQANVVRDGDVKELAERYQKYNQSVQSGVSTAITMEDESDVPLYKRRTPRPFRPSNSRGDKLLSGIGFNVHVQSISLNILNDGQSGVQQAGVTQSVTHGAPADHEKGFGGEEKKDGNKSHDQSPRGGLRRLESRRLEIAKELDDCVTGLINAAGDYFKSRSQATIARQQSGIKGTDKPSRHIPPNLPAITHYRSRAVEYTQRLHSLTWDIAVRRANCFSQALGIAVTSYMASLSDGGPAFSRREHAAVWARHGYLVTFEGLLSAVGKELGMIEDASIAISMLRMVNVVLVPDDTNSSHHTPDSNATRQRIPVPYSPYVRWVNLTPYGSHSKTQYRLEIGLDATYYRSRIPGPLRNGAAVRFFPVLFQMGVDIRQWGVNAGRNVTSQIKSGGGIDDLENNNFDLADDANGSILDDGDEDGDGDVETDNEIMYVLNVEGLKKLNAYAHSVDPTTAGVSTSAPPPVFDALEQQQQQAHPLPIHPSLVSLSDAIKASAGKMEHSVLDRAATACQRMGGGSTVFCKSGKDRTAMEVTFKQAQFVQRHMSRKDDNTMLEDTPIVYEEVYTKSSLMRKHGNRIPICEKNTGEPRLAFNPLQRKFMPEMLRPEASLCKWSKPET